jgi:hypothetical protein
MPDGSDACLGTRTRKTAPETGAGPGAVPPEAAIPPNLAVLAVAVPPGAPIALDLTVRLDGVTVLDAVTAPEVVAAPDVSTARIAGERARGSPAGQVRVLGGPASGFGRMWQKSYRMNAGPGVRPGTVMAAWEECFPGLWPAWQRGTVSVLYADAESFTVTTGPRDRLVGWITLTTEQAAHGTVVSVRVLLRAHDPLCELGLVLGGSRRYDQCWTATMNALARRLGVAEPVVETSSVCLDARRKWANTRNLARSPALPGQAWRENRGGNGGRRGVLVWRGVLGRPDGGG